MVDDINPILAEEGAIVTHFYLNIIFLKNNYNSIIYHHHAVYTMICIHE